MSVFDGDKELSQAEIEAIVANEVIREEAIRRSRPPVVAATPSERQAFEIAAAAGGGAVLAEQSRKGAFQSLGTQIMGEYDEIRNDPELAARNMDQMARTYQNFVEQTGNPVEYFIPARDYYAAGRLKDGSDVVFFDPSAPHPGIMAHELGHVHMNHQTNALADPLAWLQTSGVGRWSGQNAEVLGGTGAALGALGGQVLSRMRGKGNNIRNQAIGTAIGGAAGTLAGSGQAAYEIGGATGRAFNYLPSDVDAMDVAGDLGKAGSTYLLGGPIAAATTAAGVGGALLAAAQPGTRKYLSGLRRRAGERMETFLQKTKGKEKEIGF